MKSEVTEREHLMKNDGFDQTVISEDGHVDWVKGYPEPWPSGRGLSMEHLLRGRISRISWNGHFPKLLLTEIRQFDRKSRKWRTLPTSPSFSFDFSKFHRSKTHPLKAHRLWDGRVLFRIHVGPAGLLIPKACSLPRKHSFA
jgi:hypothetical protein